MLTFILTKINKFCRPSLLVTCLLVTLLVHYMLTKVQQLANGSF